MPKLAKPHPQEEDNPFKLPPDDQIFAIREKERQRRAEEREKVKQQHVWEKVCRAQLHLVKMRANGSVSVSALGFITSPVSLRTSASRISRTRRVDATGKHEYIRWRGHAAFSSSAHLQTTEDGIDDTQVAAEAARKARSDPRTEGLPIGLSPRSSTRSFPHAYRHVFGRGRDARREKDAGMCTSRAGFGFAWARSGFAVESVSRRT